MFIKITINVINNSFHVKLDNWSNLTLGPQALVQIDKNNKNNCNVIILIYSIYFKKEVLKNIIKFL